MAQRQMATNIAAPDTPAGQYSQSFNNRYYLHTTDVNGEHWTLNTPAWMDVPSMNETVGLQINTPEYQAQLDQATRAQGIADRGAYQQVASQAFNQLRANQNSVLTQLRQQQAQALLNGAARGVSAAQQLQGVIDMNAQNSQLMTQIRQQQAQTYLNEQAQLASNVAKAVQYVDANKQYLGNLSRDRYSIDWQGLVGAGQAAANIIGEREAAHAAMYAADKAAEAQIEAARISAAAYGGGGGGGGYYGGGGGNGSGYEISSVDYGTQQVQITDGNGNYRTISMAQAMDSGFTIPNANTGASAGNRYYNPGYYTGSFNSNGYYSHIGSPAGGGTTTHWYND